MNTNLQSLIRMLLAAIGAFLIGHTIWGTPITNAFIDAGTGIVIEIVSLVWGIKAKTATIEMVESTVRNVVAFVGGFLVAKGLLSADQLVAIIGGITALASYIFSQLSKQKTQALVVGKLTVDKLVTNKAA